MREDVQVKIINPQNPISGTFSLFDQNMTEERFNEIKRADTTSMYKKQTLLLNIGGKVTSVLIQDLVLEKTNDQK